MTTNATGQQATATSRQSRDGRRLLRVTLVVASLVLCGVTLAAVAGGQASDPPTVSVENTTVAPDANTTVGVTLSEAPDGVAGFELSLSVADTDTAEIISFSIPDTFSFQDASRDGDQVQLVASDAGNSVTSGASDVLLGNLTVSGVATGETTISVQVEQFDADGGTVINATTRAGTVTVESDTPPDDSTSDDDAGDSDDRSDETGDDETVDDETEDGGDGDDGTTGGGGISQIAVVGVVVLGAAGIYLLVRGRSDDDDDVPDPPPPQ